ncbi:hypothetical protein BCU74_15400 [Vibrio breoganii]|nr:hypothetical protein BCU74_15400 [Vibrio breoganii]TKG24657.1 hypothetical protein FCV81_00600 [Vibrio breoganii]
MALSKILNQVQDDLGESAVRVILESSENLSRILGGTLSTMALSKILNRVQDDLGESAIRVILESSESLSRIFGRTLLALALSKVLNRVQDDLGELAISYQLSAISYQLSAIRVILESSENLSRILGGTLSAMALSKVLNRVQDDICPISRIAYFAICTERKKGQS